MPNLIYETSGRAREYFELGCHIYRGCSHGCKYCYNALGREGVQFYQATPREGYVDQLSREAEALASKGETRKILLSFTCDPYQPLDREYQKTRRALEVLKGRGLHVAILTKGGRNASRDFDLLDAGDEFGITLTGISNNLAATWENGAARPSERITVLSAAKEAGLRTFVSVEPVLYPGEALAAIEATKDLADIFLVGKLNHRLPPVPIDWAVFARQVMVLLAKLHKPYYIKQDLARYVGHPEGIRSPGDEERSTC